MCWIRGAAWLLLGYVAFGCTPIDGVKQSPPEKGAPSDRRERDAATEDASPTAVGTVVTQASPCVSEGERACLGHGVREMVVCKDGTWMPDTPCGKNERCDSTKGTCAPIAPVCTGQEPGSVFCDGDRRLVCDDLVSAREIYCGENQQCSRKDGQVSCTCAPGAEPTPAGERCEFVSDCGADGSGCDPLTRCVLSGGNERTCTPCPQGYVGDGRRGCIPQLETLDVTCGEDAPRAVELTSGIYEYRMVVPLLCQRVTLMAAGPDNTQLEIDGVTVEPGRSRASELLRIGDNTVKLVVTAPSGRSSSYQLKLERAGSKSDYLKASNARADASFGFTMAADGPTLIVTAPFESSDSTAGDNLNALNAGAAYAFELEDDKWIQKQLLKADAPREGEMFGMSAALAGDVLVIGAPRFNLMLFKVVAPREPGAAHVFRRKGSTWVHEQLLRPSEGSGADMFGADVAVHGETVLVGAPYDSAGGSHAGAIYSFVQRDGSWVQDQKLLARAPIAESSLGLTLAVDGDVFVAGALQDSSEEEAAGSAYVFVRDAGAWTEAQRLVAPTPKARATFGAAVAIEGDRVLVTAPGLDLRQRQTPAGEAFLFTRDRSSNAWTFTQQFRATVPYTQDLFGGAAALISNGLIITANGDASSSRGADGNPQRGDAPLSGAAYVYALQGAEYVLSAYLKSFNSDEGDNFGHSVAATDTFVAIAGPFESSSQRGVSSQDQANGSDNSANASGAVYVYR